MIAQLQKILLAKPYTKLKEKKILMIQVNKTSCSKYRKYVCAL